MLILPYLDLRGGKGDGVVVNSTQVYCGVALSVEIKTSRTATFHHHEYQCHLAIIALLQQI